MTPPPNTRRDRVYEALKAAGSKGVSDHELKLLGISGPVAPHLESLRFEEGFGLTSRTTHEGPRNEPVRRWVMTEDPWAGEELDANLAGDPVEKP